jgi:hypothetical protein
MTLQIQSNLKNYPSRENINSLFKKSLNGQLEVQDLETFEIKQFKEGISA